MSTHRIFNFSAGPAVLPLPVLEEAQRDLVALPGVGMSVTEISHRSKTFEGILAKAVGDFRELSGLPSNYRVLLLQGGASLQFSMVPMNLLGAGQTAVSNHLRVLRLAGVVDAVPAGRFTYYELRSGAVAAIAEHYTDLAASSQTVGRRPC